MDDTKTDDKKMGEEHTEKAKEIDTKIEDLKAEAETAAPEEKTGIMAKIEDLKAEKEKIMELVSNFTKGKEQVADIAAKAKDVLGGLHL